MNIVFDLGGVVFDWDVKKIIKTYFKNPETFEIIRTQIFVHPDWLELDRGTIEKEMAIERAAVRCGMDKQLIAEMFEGIASFLKPIPKTVKLAKKIKKAGYPIFALSNMHNDYIDYLEKRYSFMSEFSGKVISCRIKLVKPEPGIYKYLLNEYSLDPKETIFIDDTQANLDAAAEQGIKVIKFNSSGQCAKDLKKSGCKF